MSIELKVNPLIKQLRDEFTGKVYKPSMDGNVMVDIAGHSARIFINSIDND